MSTAYPSQLDKTLATGGLLRNDATDATITATDHAAQHDNLADAVIAIETVLGTSPQGSYASVALALVDAIKKTPANDQIIQPSADRIPLGVQQHNNADISDVFQARNATGTVKAFIDKTFALSAQALKIAGVALSSIHLSDGALIAKKDASFALQHVQGISPGLSGNPQAALVVSGSGTWTLSIATGWAYIQGTDDVSQGMYLFHQTGSGSLPLPTHAPATNPRVDAICVEYNDSLFTGRTPADQFAYLQVLGTPTAGANTVNLNGKPAVPASALLLAYIVVNPGDTGVANGNVVDARKLHGPAIWGEDGHRYRLGVNASGGLGLEQIV